jgi:hypothetical protein
VHPVTSKSKEVAFEAHTFVVHGGSACDSGVGSHRWDGIRQDQ